MGYLSDSDRALRLKLERVKHAAARDYYLRKGYLSSSFNLPDYYGGIGFKEMNLGPVDWDKQPPKRTVPINIYTPKGKGWRRFGVLHPYAYWHMVNTFTDEDFWTVIINKLCKRSLVSCYSTPLLSSKANPTGAGILSWLQMAENDMICDSDGFSYLLTCDIQNYYSSIYTHSISWAIEGKAIAQANWGDMSLLGNRADKLFQNSRNGQTNGIVTGNVLSDLMAELILKDIDNLLCEELKVVGIKFKAARYRDDYRFLCLSAHDGEQIAKILNRILHDNYDLSLNNDKTLLFSDVLEGSLRPSNLAIKNSNSINNLTQLSVGDYMTGKMLREYLIATYEIQKAYPMNRPAITILSTLNERVGVTRIRQLTTNDIEYATVVLRKLIKLREEITPQAILLLDQLLSLVSSSKKLEAISNIRKFFLNETDRVYQEIWLYRLCTHHAPSVISKYFLDSDNPFIRAAMQPEDEHFKYFTDPKDNIAMEDIQQLSKFKLVDKAVLASALEKPMTRDEISPFAY